MSGIQTWQEQPRYTEVNPTGQVVLKCRVAAKKGDCRWEKDGQPVGIYPGKYVWAGRPETGDCSLRVFNASLEFDDGVWQCQVTPSSFNSKDALISEGAELVVRGNDFDLPPLPPPPPFSPGKRLCCYTQKCEVVH